MSKHSETPWHIGSPTGLRPTHTIFNKPFGLGDVAEVYNADDAAHIVRCVNTHAQLVEALEAICANGGAATNAMLISARAALAAARGEA